MSMLTIIEPDRTAKNYWGDLWRYRELFQVLAWRDISVRYRQTAVGIVWALIRPLLTMIILTFVFGQLAKLPSEGSAPYPLMVLAGMLPWTFFANALSDSSTSLITNSNLIGKIYFPRLIVPMAVIVVASVDLMITFVILVAMMIWYQFLPGWQLLLLPIFILVAFMAAVGPSLWISAMTVKYRDFRYIVPFLVQFGLYISPVGFSSSIVPDRWHFVFSLNPMVGIIDGFRWCILRGESPIDAQALVISIGVILACLYLGVRKFMRLEKSFADVI